VGTQSVDEYCREIETYLCRKNDGHLIRVVGPSFDLVSGWAAGGVPLKVAFRGIDRYFERYYAKGARRRPVKIDFCEADVLDVFDEWRRAIGLTHATVDGGPGAGGSSTSGSPASNRSLPAHLSRVVLRLTEARTKGTLSSAFDDIIDRFSHELDEARSKSQGLRGTARQALIDRLGALDAELLQAAKSTVDDDVVADLSREAEEELVSFRSTMSAEAFERARHAATDRLIRERFGLPVVAFGEGK
jgi:hypothetical protein